jgi:hypothetical protein
MPWCVSSRKRLTSTSNTTDLEADLKKFDKLKPKELGQISTITELGHADSPPTYVLFKGIYDRKLEECSREFPRCSPIRSRRSAHRDFVGPSHGARELDREPETTHSPRECS